jgi:ribulose-phosphate 3-epimerase
LAINPDRPLSVVTDSLHTIDYLLILSVFPGFGGQTFIEDTIRKMEEAHEYRVTHNLSYDIAVDGGVNMHTAKKILQTGVNVLIAGTAIYGQPDIKKAIRDFLLMR